MSKLTTEQFRWLLDHFNDNAQCPCGSLTVEELAVLQEIYKTGCIRYRSSWVTYHEIVGYWRQQFDAVVLSRQLRQITGNTFSVCHG